MHRTLTLRQTKGGARPERAAGGSAGSSRRSLLGGRDAAAEARRSAGRSRDPLTARIALPGANGGRYGD
eukprot:6892986-Pyramimonas_sp.AAC.1